MNNYFKKIVIILAGILVILIIIFIILGIVNNGEKKDTNTNTAVQNAENITYQEVTDINTLSSKAKDKIDKLKRSRGNYILEYGEQTIIMLSQGIKQQQVSTIDIMQILKNNNGEYTINIRVGDTQQYTTGNNENERYLYKIVKVNVKFDKDTVCYVSNEGTTIQRVIDADGLKLDRQH